MGLHNFRGLGGEKSLVYRDLQMGRSTVKKLSPYFAQLFNNQFAVKGRGMPFPRQASYQQIFTFASLAKTFPNMGMKRLVLHFICLLLQRG